MRALSDLDPGEFGPASGVLSIDIGALRANYAHLERLAGVPVAAVVKADAYGLGAGIVAPALAEEGCRTFCVAHLSEGLQLRPSLSAEHRIFVLNGLLPGGEAVAARAGLVPVLNSLEQLRAWSQQASMEGRRLPAVLQFDTGMSRLGLPPEHWPAAAAAIAETGMIDLLFVMSHLASADTPEDGQNAAQLAQMQQALAGFAGAKLCFANSGGIFLDPRFRGDMVRAGIALYGGAPMSDRANPMRAVVGLELAVIQTRRVAPGTLIGYGGTHVARREMTLATLAAGYADGLPRSLSDRGAAYFEGQRLPIVGRVSMDSMVVDISALADGALGAGSRVEMIGPQQSLDQVARDAGTISYEILTGLGRRYVRRYSARDGAAVSGAA